MPHKVEEGWRWGNIVRPTKGELVRVVHSIWQKNGSKGQFEEFWETGKTGDSAPDAKALAEYLSQAD